MLKRLAAALALSTAIGAIGTSEAQAMPAAIAGVAVFAATPLGGFVVNLGVGLAANAIGTLIDQALHPKSSGAPVSGIHGTVRDGGVVPIGFIVGRRATAGSRPYHGYWGDAGKTPNAYYTDVRTIADLPMPNLTGLWINGKLCTVLWEEEPNEKGYPVAEFRDDNGRDHMWVWFLDGTQTTANAFLRAKFGTHPARPYTADMIGRGLTQVIVTSRVNRELFSGFPDVLAETDGIPLYDISLDSTAGGSGPQRRDDPSTWVPSKCLPVQIYNILIGIYWGDEWVYGLQGTPASRLPASSWIAAIAEAKAATALAEGGTEAQFEGGFEITCDMEPAGVIEEMLKGCAGRIAEVGGIYKMLCGAPGTAVYAFTDRDIVVSREQGFDPFPVIEETHNGIQSSYLEPSAGWKPKDAPPRYSSALELADAGNRLAVDVRYEMPFSGTQVQRLMKATIEEARRFRRHSLGLPPDAADLEPLDVVDWSSARNGYANKKFLITELDDEPNYFQAASLQEVEPSDYDYHAGTDELPSSVGPLEIVRPVSQPFEGFAVAAATVYDDAAQPRRPTIRLFWNGEQYDVAAVLWEVELLSSEAIVASGQLDNVAAGSAPLPPTYLPSTTYRVHARFRPFSSRTTEWSEWLTVTTDDVPEIGPGTITPAMFGQELANQSGVLMDNGAGSVADRLAQLRQLMEDLAGALIDTAATAQQRLDLLEVQHGGSMAGVIHSEQLIANETLARATAITEIFATFGDALAGGFLKLEGTADAESATSSVIAKVKAAVGSLTSTAAFELRASVNDAEVLEAIFVLLGKLYVVVPGGDGTPIPAIETLDDGTVKFVGTRMGRIDSLDGLSYIDFSDGIDIYSESSS